MKTNYTMIIYLGQWGMNISLHRIKIKTVKRYLAPLLYDAYSFLKFTSIYRQCSNSNYRQSIKKHSLSYETLWYNKKVWRPIICLMILNY